MDMREVWSRVVRPALVLLPVLALLLAGRASLHASADGTPTRTVAESGGLLLSSRSSGSCTADVPDGWLMLAGPASDTLDLLDPSGAMYAGYGIKAVNTLLADAAVLYEPPLNDPDLYSREPATVAAAYARLVLGSLGAAPDVQVLGRPEPVGGYALFLADGTSHSGAVLFHARGLPGSGTDDDYVLPMYLAFTTADRWERDGALVARIAASIRCATVFQPSDGEVAFGLPGQEGEAGTPEDAGYDPWLGTEYVTDPLTGDNYLVSPSGQWSETGPDGPGYYAAKAAGDYQKLEPGRTD